MTLNIGKVGSQPFTLPADLQVQTTAILGIRNSGKTTTAVAAVEELLDIGAQIVVIDPLDVWWGLKSSRDGKSAGYPVVVLGGEHGDLPLSARDGGTVADFAVDERVPIVVSLRHLRKHEQRSLVTEFAEQIYHRKGEQKNRVPLLLVIDETSTFAPQHVGSNEARMVGAIEDLVRRGRSSGIGMIAIDQRPASINKDVLTQLELLICHRLTSPQDRKALEEWIKAHDTADRGAEFMSSLAALQQGTAWFWSPGWDLFERVNVRDRRTFDSSATPKAGAKPAAPKKLADVDLVAIKAKLSATIEQARANDPKELKRQIAELEKQVRGYRVQGEREANSAPANKEALAQREQAWREHAENTVAQEMAIMKAIAANVAGMVDADHRSLGEIVGRQRQLLDRLKSWIEKADLKLGELPKAAVNSARRIIPKTIPPRPSPHETRPSDNGDRLPKGELAILTACAQYHPEGCTREQLTVLTGYKRSSRDTYIQRLWQRGYLEPGGFELVATAAGVSALGDGWVRLPIGDDLRKWWLARLPAGEMAVLVSVIEAYPEALPREAISQATGYKRSSRDTYLQRLNSRRLIETTPEGVIAADILFG